MDNDENLPKATVGSFVKENLNGMKCSNDFIDLILKVSREYISVISDEANKICLKEGKKTIAPIFIYEALKRHQLESQITELEDAKQRFTEENQKSSNDLYKDPELFRILSQQQEMLFEKSRNQTEAQILGLDKIQSNNNGEDFVITDIKDIIKGNVEDKLNSIPQEQQPEQKEESDDYED